MSFTRPIIPGAGPRPINTPEDVLAHLPAALTDPAIDPVRDRLAAALAAMLIEWEYRSDYGAALSDLGRSVKQYLAALANDHGVSRVLGEDDDALRTRAFHQDCVTEASIIAGVNAILSLITTTECQLNDGVLDRWFINDGTDGNGNPAIWHSFIGSGPNYPDRLFADDAVNNGGYYRPNSEVGGARLYGDSLGRFLLLRVPDFGYQSKDAPFVYQNASLHNDLASVNELAGLGFFVGDGSDPEIASYINATDTDPFVIYRAIASFMDAVVGESIRWEMISDLVAA